MKFLGVEIRRAPIEQKAQFDDLLRQLVAAQSTALGNVTPDNCMRSPTVHAIVSAISRRISVSPIHIYERGESKGRETKKRLPNHPVAKLLNAPNGWQSKADYWLDAASCFIRYGKFFAYQSRGSTGPIRELIPIHPLNMEIVQDPQTYQVSYKVTEPGAQRVIPASKIHYVRGPARDFLNGNSPVEDVKLSIQLEIAAEEYGASFFNNGALPLMILKYMQGSMGFKTAEAEKQFVEDFQSAFGGSNRHRALLLPRGIEAGEPVRVENDKAQMIESRRYQRTVIAGAFGVPPQYTGDLERATFNNVEQQTIGFTSDVIYPVAQSFEAAMERDLLTDDDRRGGVIIRFNLDSTLRADFASRQAGLRVQRDAGVISPNEWREIEGKNPISEEDGGDDYIRPANMLVAGEPVKPAPKPGGGMPNDDMPDDDMDKMPKA
jgi:HK97 family phage portal protein